MIHAMRLSHVNITIPPRVENRARAFYSELLGLTEIPKPEAIRSRGGLWYDVGGIDLHLSAEQNRGPADAYRHFGIELADLDTLQRASRQQASRLTPADPPRGNVSSCTIPSATELKFTNRAPSAVDLPLTSPDFHFISLDEHCKICIFRIGLPRPGTSRQRELSLALMAFLEMCSCETRENESR